ncbi:MAG: hypothetical protein GY821_10825 [Gammaproteobacteria bacterium]|nr:hypothetical protein [Gammaproteobacteria bacterium]
MPSALESDLPVTNNVALRLERLRNKYISHNLYSAVIKDDDSFKIITDGLLNLSRLSDIVISYAVHQHKDSEILKKFNLTIEDFMYRGFNKINNSIDDYSDKIKNNKLFNDGLDLLKDGLGLSKMVSFFIEVSKEINKNSNLSEIGKSNRINALESILSLYNNIFKYRHETSLFPFFNNKDGIKKSNIRDRVVSLIEELLLNSDESDVDYNKLYKDCLIIVKEAEEFSKEKSNFSREVLSKVPKKDWTLIQDADALDHGGQRLSSVARSS